MSHSAAKRSFAFVTLLGVAAGCSSGVKYYPGVADLLDAGSIVATGDGGKPQRDSGSFDDPDEDERPDGGSIKKDGGSSTKDASTTKDTGTTTQVCAPGSVSSFSPDFVPFKPAHANACTTAQVNTLITCLFDSLANQTTCDNFFNDSANANCQQCVVTYATDAAYGPLIVRDGDLVSLNLGGCIGILAGNTTASGCGAKLQAADQCGDAACASNCPLVSGNAQSVEDYQLCTENAAAGDCSGYQTTAETCATPLIDVGGAAESCINGASFLDNAKTIAKLFCSP